MRKQDSAVWHWRRGTAIAVVAVALHTWGCATEIAPEIETERRFSGTVQAPPPAPAMPFDMSLFLRKLAAGQHGVSGGFTAGPVQGSVAGTLTGSLDNGTFAGRLIAPETRPAVAGPAAASGKGPLALIVIPAMAWMAAMQDSSTGCIVEQEYTGTITPAGLVWTPREVVRSCPTNPLNFSIQAATLTQQATTSVSTTSTTPTTSVSTTTSTTTTSIPTTSTTTTTSVPTTSTTTSTTSTTTTTIAPPPI